MRMEAEWISRSRSSINYSRNENSKFYDGHRSLKICIQHTTYNIQHTVGMQYIILVGVKGITRTVRVSLVGTPTWYVRTYLRTPSVPKLSQHKASQSSAIYIGPL